MPKFATNLHELQKRLQRDIMDGTTKTLEELSVPKNAEPSDRLKVYQNAYLMRLVEIISKDFDTTWTYIGDQLFYEMATGYVRSHPSQTTNARFFSHGFPEFLADKLKTQAAVAEISLIERALEDAFDSQDIPPIDFSHLEKVAPENVVKTTFIFHPSANLLSLNTNAYEIFRALRAEETPPAQTRLEAALNVLIWRKALKSMHMPLAYEEGVLLQAAQSGEPFLSLCEICATIQDPETAAGRMAGYIRKWFDSEILIEISVASE